MEAGIGTEVDSFRALVDRHSRTVYRLARDLTGNHHDAEDLAQDVFMKAYRAMDGFRGEGSGAAWLRRITVTTYLNARRSTVRRMTSLFAEGDASETASDHVAPDAAARAAVIRGHVQRALDRLSPRERTAFVLRHLQDHSLRETAEAMGAAEGTVKSLLHRSLRKMRTALSPYAAEYNAPGS